MRKVVINKDGIIVFGPDNDPVADLVRAEREQEEDDNG